MANHDQIKRAPSDQLETLFINNKGVLWSGKSPKSNAGPGLNFGVQEPFMWTGLNDSSFKKNIKRYDNRAFPIGSTVQDVQRITKFMGSSRGIFFSIVQLSIQKENAFNETRVWNPLSPISASAQKGLLGLMERPTRHIEGAGGSLLGNIKAGFMSAIGIQSDSMKSQVQGIATGVKSGEAISLEASKGKGYASKGFVRYETGDKARSRFTEHWGASTGTSGGGFLSKLASGLISKLKSLIPTTNSPDADWKYRVEFSGKTDVLKVMSEDKAGLLSFTVKSGKNPTGKSFKVGFVQYYTIGKIYSPSFLTITDRTGGTIESNQKDLAAGKFNPNKLFGTDVVNKRDPKEFSTEVSNIITTNNDAVIEAVQKWNSGGIKIDNGFYNGGVNFYKERNAMAKTKSLRYGSKRDPYSQEARNQFPRVHEHDKYNALGDENGFIPKDGYASLMVNEHNSRDQIFFYFFDMVNERYIPFRATVNGINENGSPKWEEVNYMGRADTLYAYNGFTRTLNFGFTVYANSVRELIPMWARINYLKGLIMPPKYTDGNGESISNFMYPPMIKFRIGDLYVDQPAVLASIGLTIPDDVPWETVRSDGTYKYLVGTHQELQVPGKARQLPMKVDISISLNLMEKKLAMTGNRLHYTDEAAAVVTPTEEKTTKIEPFKAGKIEKTDTSLTSNSATSRLNTPAVSLNNSSTFTVPAPPANNIPPKF